MSEELAYVKSYSFPDGEIRGDMHYIKHISDNFTVIDCYLKEGTDRSCRKEEILNEIKRESGSRITRFVSTHPDNDHIKGIGEVMKALNTSNFYAVDNNVKHEDGNSDLDDYIKIRKSDNYALEYGITRKWFNESSDNRHGSGLCVLWPKVDNEKYKAALKAANEGQSPNNISCVLRYAIEDGPSFMWMGDMETEMQEEFYAQCKNSLTKVDVLFYPHHGRESGRIPDALLKALDPQIVVIGNAPSDKIGYCDSELSLTRNSTGDIIFHWDGTRVWLYTANDVDNWPSCLDEYKGPELKIGNCSRRGSFKLRS